MTLALERARRNVVTNGANLDVLIGEVICFEQRRCQPAIVRLEACTDHGRTEFQESQFLLFGANTLRRDS